MSDNRRRDKLSALPPVETRTETQYGPCWACGGSGIGYSEMYLGTAIKSYRCEICSGSGQKVVKVTEVKRELR